MSTFLIESLRYAFRSPEKVALQEIGPRFTLKLRWLKKGIPAVYHYVEDPQPLTVFPSPDADGINRAGSAAHLEKEPSDEKLSKTIPPKRDEFIWQWKVCIHFNTCIWLTVTQQPDLETSRKTFFL